MAPLTDSAAFGRMSIRDLEIADGEIQAADTESAPDAARVAAAFRDTPEPKLAQIYAAARSALADVQAIDGIFNERTPGRGPRLDPLLQALRKAVRRLSTEVAAPEPEAETGTTEGAAPTAATAPRSAPGVVADRADVERAIDGILAYYARCEPSSPVPILLNRAKKLVGADFMTIVREMAPGGADHVKLIGGIE
jgi:type VI secretion system protein ImpA